VAQNVILLFLPVKFNFCQVLNGEMVKQEVDYTLSNEP